MNSDNKLDDDLDGIQENDRLLENRGKNENNEQPDIPFCGCLSVRFYQPV